MNEKKEGVELIIDRAEALRVRMAQHRQNVLVPPTSDVDLRLADVLGHWEQLCKEVLAEATAMKLRNEYQPLQKVYDALDRIGALMAMPKEAPAAEIASAVQTALKRLQELELRVANYTEASTPPQGVRFAGYPPTSPPPIAEGRILRSEGTNSPRYAYLMAGVGAGVLDPDDAAALLGSYEPYTKRAPVSVDPRSRHHDSDEPRASWVQDRMEALVLGGWLEDATRNIERVSEYMAANESRMSEDLFDELRRIAAKLESWANSVRKGEMFPRDVP